MIITFDGPVASGKSTIAKFFAGELNYMYLNTGLLYRAFAFCLVNDKGYKQENLAFPKQEDINFVIKVGHICYKYSPEISGAIIYKGENITERLKYPDADQWASIVSTNPNVRQALLYLQRKLAETNNVIAEGRDCGTVVFPMAEKKFFLTASQEVRAKRWQKDQEKRGNILNYEEALASLLERDTRDTTRAIAPLKIPENAHIIDSSNLNFEETVNLIKEYLKI